MIQCKDCQYCNIDEAGRRSFTCDPFSNIVEPECIQKWQLIRLDHLLGLYHRMVSGQEQLKPIQDKMLKYVEREMDDINEAEKWKIEEDEEYHWPEDEQNNDTGPMI